ncbi:arrestin domain-containing protein [Poronia punctata]|nr:arrestin domain-containing protein [Poronia punctata]
MPSFNPFASAAGRLCSLFEIRLDNDFVVFRGEEHEASGQQLNGVLVLCLKESLKVDDIHLRLMGQCRVAWMESSRQTPAGMPHHKVDRTTTVLRHEWAPFISDHQTLPAGNYEWPFEITLPGDTAESVEGLYQTGITYLFKATVNRGKLARNLHAYKRLRIIRTLDPAALELNHAMSVENLWTNKVEYSIVIPQKAVVFGTTVPLEMRFTPLLKGLEMGKITIKLVEVQEFTSSTSPMRTHKNERDVTTWYYEVEREKHWHDIIEETGQDGWVVKEDLPLPKKLNKCLQDCCVRGIKIRHKLRLAVALKNPDGHTSELRASLPITIFISPNMPLDEDGNLVAQSPDVVTQNVDAQRNMAPPGYGQHVLDQLYDDADISGTMTPGAYSGFSSPFYGQSRSGSVENLGALSALHGTTITPAALSSRLQNMSMDDSRHGRFHPRYESGIGSGALTPIYREGEQATEFSHGHSPPLSRRTSEENLAGASQGAGPSGHSTPPAHSEFPSLEELSRVPSYTTATKTPLPRNTSFPDSLALPDYNAAMSAPGSPAQTPSNPMDTVAEYSAGPPESEARRPRSASSAGGNHVHGFSFIPSHAAVGGNDGERRLRLLQHRGTS